VYIQGPPHEGRAILFLTFVLLSSLLAQSPSTTTPAAEKPAATSEKPKASAPAKAVKPAQKAPPKKPVYTVETMRGDVPAPTPGPKG